MPLTIQDILDRSGALILETQENSITPPRVGELTYALAELILQGSLGGNVIGASKLKDLEDVMLLGEQDNDILQLMGGKWKNTNLDLTKLQAMAGYFELDDDGNLFTTYNLYSTKGVSAYGAGSGSDGSGAAFSRLDAWSLYTNDKSGWVLSALLGKELHDRVLVLEAGGGGGGIATEIDPTVAAHIKNITTGDLANWATAYAKSHEHANISILHATTASFLTADRNKLDGIAAGAQVNVQANWDAVSGPVAILNKPSSLPASDVHPWAKALTKPSYVASEIGGLGANYRWLTDAYISTWNSAVSNMHSHTNKSLLDAFSQSDNDVLNHLSIVDGKLKVDIDFYSTGEVSAYGAGSGSGGGGGSFVTWGITTTNYAELTVEGDGKNVSLSGHKHEIADINSLTSALAGKEPAITKLTAFNKNFGTTAGTVAEGNHTHTFASLTSKPTTLAGYGITDALLASAYNATDVLAKLLTVDGSGSGLDADTVDGKHVTTSGWYDKIALITADGVMEVGKYIDFHEVSTGGPDYAGRLSSYGGSPLWGVNAIYHSGNSNRTDTDWTAKTLIAETDITTNFNTWTHGSSKSLKKFLELFDIDIAGNLVVKTNLYSMGEVSAYKPGTGISGLTLMADMNANGKNINNLTSISKLDSKIRLLGNSIAFDIEGYDNQLTIADDGIYANTIIEASSFYASGIVNAPEFKFGNWSFKEVSGNMVIYYNGTAKATIQSGRTNSNL